MQRVVLYPVLCSCNKNLGHLGREFENLQVEGSSREEAFDLLGVERVCCRMNLANPPVYILPRLDWEAISGRKSPSLETRRGNEESCASPDDLTRYDLNCRTGETALASIYETQPFRTPRPAPEAPVGPLRYVAEKEVGGRMTVPILPTRLLRAA